MIKRKGQKLNYDMLEAYPAYREMIDGQLLCVEEIMRTSLFNVGFEKMWELLSENERIELKSVILKEEKKNP